MTVIPRAEAKSHGLPRYFTGNACRNGHIAQRYTRNGECCECGRIRLEAGRAKRTKNLPARQKMSAEQVREAARIRARAYREKNAQKVRARQADYRSQNRDRLSQASRDRYSMNRDALLKQIRAWQSKNKDKVRAIKRAATNKRRCRKLQAVPAWYGELDELLMFEAADLARLREKATGIEWHVDHCIPIAAKKACGLHCADNIQVIPALLNSFKSNRMIFTEPLQWLGALE